MMDTFCGLHVLHHVTCTSSQHAQGLHITSCWL
jgi:hypothetical protein